MRIYIAKAYRKCVSTIDSIEERNRQYRKISNGKVESVNPETGQCIFSLSPADLKFLADFTDIMYRETRQALDRILDIDGKIQQFIRADFKKKHALKMQIVGGFSR